MTGRAIEEEWRRVEREAFDRHSDEVRLADAVGGMVATAGPIAVGLASGHPHAGMVVGLGGLNVALSMGAGRPRARAPWGLATLVLGAAVTGVATLVHPVAWSSVVLAFVVCGLASASRVLGREATLVGFVVSASFVIADGLEGVAADAGPRALQYLAGGALALVLMLVAGLADPVTAPASVDRSRAAALRAVRTRPGLQRHMVVVASTVAATTLLYRALGVDFGYWIPLTALAVLQPEAHASRVRVVQRASGTMVGVLVVVVLVRLSSSDVVLVGGVAVAAFGLFALRERSYHWLVTMITPTVLLMISTIDPEATDLVETRLVATALGLAASLVAITALGWPDEHPSAASGTGRRDTSAPGPRDGD